MNVRGAGTPEQMALLSRWVFVVAKQPPELREEAFASIEQMFLETQSDPSTVPPLLAWLRKQVAAAAVLGAHSEGTRH